MRLQVHFKGIKLKGNSPSFNAEGIPFNALPASSASGLLAKHFYLRCGTCCLLQLGLGKKEFYFATTTKSWSMLIYKYINRNIPIYALTSVLITYSSRLSCCTTGIFVYKHAECSVYLHRWVEFVLSTKAVLAFPIIPI